MSESSDQEKKRQEKEAEKINKLLEECTRPGPPTDVFWREKEEEIEHE